VRPGLRVVMMGAVLPDHQSDDRGCDQEPDGDHERFGPSRLSARSATSRHIRHPPLELVVLSADGPPFEHSGSGGRQASPRIVLKVSNTPSMSWKGWRGSPIPTPAIPSAAKAAGRPSCRRGGRVGSRPLRLHRVRHAHPRHVHVQLNDIGPFLRCELEFDHLGPAVAVHTANPGGGVPTRERTAATLEIEAIGSPAIGSRLHWSASVRRVWFGNEMAEAT
jgi:hypothetical protein